MKEDAEEFVRKCHRCQLFKPMIHQPAEDLQPITSPWPFAQWGLDIVGELPLAPGGFRYLITATDYFSKWVEAEPLVFITEANVKSFLWQNIISRYGVPYAIVSDNGKQFTGKQMKEVCDKLGVRFFNSTPVYPQGNGQAEASNKTVAAGIKRRLTAKRGKWVEELPHVLWAFRTTPRRSTGQTPYSLAYGIEAVIPIQKELPTIRTEHFDETNNDTALSNDLDLAEEKRDRARVKLAAYQQEVAKGYNKTVRLRTFCPDDLVLKKVTDKNKKKKLMPNWDGPYRVVKKVGKGAYQIEDMDGKLVDKPWNAYNLRKYYA